MAMPRGKTARLGRAFYPESPHLGGLVPPSAGAGSGRVLLCFLQVGVEWGDMGRSIPLWAHMPNGASAGACKLNTLGHETLRCNCWFGWDYKSPHTLTFY